MPARPGIRITPGANARYALRAYLWSDAREAPIPQTNFFDGEDFVYDLKCVRP